MDKKTLGVKGANPYFNLTPGYTLTYRHGKDTDTLTVLNETKRIDGMETRVVEDREMKDGQLVELTRDYYAIADDWRGWEGGRLSAGTGKPERISRPRDRPLI